MSLRLIISPAKRMRPVEGPPFAQTEPQFLSDAVSLARRLRSLSYVELRELWGCSERLAAENARRVRTLAEDMAADTGSLTAAVMAYDGIQYQHLRASVMDERQLSWLGEHLRIASGLYGLLRPFDGVVPYRLEMQARLAVDGARNLYQYWGGRPYDALCSGRDVDTIVNLASVEYARAMLPQHARGAPPHAQGTGPRVVTCLFGDIRTSDDRLVQHATEAKATRGTFVRWCAERGADSVVEMRDFDERGYALDERRSDDTTLAFTRAHSIHALSGSLCARRS